MANVNAAGQTHDQLQAACWQAALRLYHPFLEQRLFCIPNDMHAGNVARWKQYEAIGVTPGVWDMQLLWFRALPGHSILGGFQLVQVTHWFEFKVGKDILSKNQLAFQARMECIGHQFHIIKEERDMEECLKTIIEPTLHIAKEIWKEERLNGTKKSK